MGRLLIIATVLAFASPAFASGGTVVILGIRSIEGDDDVANDLTRELRGAARNVGGWEVSDRAVSMAQMSLAHSCDEMDANCLNEIAKGLHADSIIYGTLRRNSAGDDYDYAINLSLFEANIGSIAKTVDDTILRSDVTPDKLGAQASKLIGRLASTASGGAINIQVNVADAEVLVNGQPVGHTRDGALRLEGLHEGQYRVEIAKDGYAPHASMVSVTEGGNTTISAMLTTAGEAPSGAPAWEDTEPPPKTSSGAPAWLGWTLVGVGGASLIMMGYSMFRVRQIDEDEVFESYRQAVRAGNAKATKVTELVTDVCSAAKDGSTYRAEGFTGDLEDITDMCAEADTFEVLQWVFLGTAVAAGGAGAFILLTADDGEEASASTKAPTLVLTPQIGRDSAALQATLRF